MSDSRILVALFSALFCVACTTDADDEYVFDAAVVCPDNARGAFTDERDGHVYRYTTIGNQVWMAQNLNYASKDSYCMYKDDSCFTKGRVYYYEGLDSACPKGWHLPSHKEWVDLYGLMGGDSIAALRLKSAEGWLKLNVDDGPSGTDDCEFSIFPAKTVRNGNENYVASFWTSSMQSEYFRSNDDAINVWTVYEGEYFSIRCLRD